MKKFIKLTLTLAIILATLFIVSSAKEVEVLIPDYDILLNNGSVYSADSLYPFLNYKDITYFPMTWDYCRVFSLSTGYTPEDGLFIAYNPYYRDNYTLPTYEKSKNKKTEKATIADYPIYLNGRAIDNKDEEYPILNFRNVTYFPLTWDFVTKDFYMDINWQDRLLSISSDYDIKSGVPYMTGGVYKADGGVIVTMTMSEEIQLEDGSFTQKNDSWFDYIWPTASMQGLIPAIQRLDDFDEVGYSQKNTEKADVSIKDGIAYFKDLPLSEVTLLDADTLENGGSEYISGYIKEMSGVRFLFVNYRNSRKIEGGQTMSECEYLYVLENEKPIFIRTNLTPSEAAVLGGDIYFSARQFAKTVSYHYNSTYKLYKVSKGEVTLINDSFSDYNSMKLLGLYDGKLYLKCEWAPQFGIDGGGHEVSTVNDGYFTFDGENLTKIHNWIYSDEDVLLDDGTIFSLFFRKAKISVVR